LAINHPQTVDDMDLRTVTQIVFGGELEETPVWCEEERGETKRDKRWFASQA